MIKDNNKLKYIKIISILVILLLLFLLVFLILTHDNNTDKKVPITTTTKKIKKEVWNTPYGNKGIANIYYDEENKSLTIENNEEKNKIKYTYKCSNSDCVIEKLYEELGYTLIYDGGYILYNYKDDLYMNIKLSVNDYKTVRLIYYDKIIYGYVITNNDNLSAVYNKKLERQVTDYKYSLDYNNLYGSPEVIDDNYILSDSSNYYLISLRTGKEKYTINKEEYSLKSIGANNSVYYIKEYDNTSEICNKYLKPIIKGRYNNYGVNSKGNIIVDAKNNKYSIYNRKGTLIKTSKEYKKIIKIVNDYVIVLDNDNYLKIVDYDGRLLAKFIKYNNNLIINYELSGIYKKGEYERIRIIIEDTSKKQFSEYYYVPKTKKSGIIKLDNVDDYK